jgi:tRNA(fMet)-specific endonuclease VapC
LEGTVGVNGLLLDTSALSGFFRGHPGVIREIQSSPYLFLNSVVYAEAQCGYRAGNTQGRNERDLARFLDSARVDILSVTRETSLRYAEIWYFLRKAGKPIPENDMWIAATAWEH